MVAPGSADGASSALVTDRSGAAVTGVGSVAVLFAGVGSGPLVPSSATDTVLAMASTPAGNGASTTTVNTALAAARPVSSPTGRVQVPDTQTQPGDEPA